MNTSDNSSSDAGPAWRVIAELGNAIADLGGLDQLGHARLGAICDAIPWQPGRGPLQRFRADCYAAWQLSRPPTVDDLATCDEWDAGVIDWGDEDLADLAEDPEPAADLFAELRRLAASHRLDTARPVEGTDADETAMAIAINRGAA